MTKYDNLVANILATENFDLYKIYEKNINSRKIITKMHTRGIRTEI